jgi:uncharacterized protein with FMN-binding domain
MSALKKIVTAAMPGTHAFPASAGCADAADINGTGASSGSMYRNGQYRATGQYGSGPSSITVSLTLDDDAITSVAVTPHATDPTSRDFQVRFAAAVPRLVLGKNINDVHLDYVAGSSLTPDGFNAALQYIKDEAAPE